VDDEPFCEQIVEKLQSLCGTAVQAIGSLDIGPPLNSSEVA
jgi:hypothetical protein